MSRDDRFEWRYRERDGTRVPFLRNCEDELPSLELAPIDLPESTRPLYSGLPMPAGEDSTCRARLLFVHQNNLELTVRFLIDDGATAITFWDGTTALDYQIPTEDVFPVVEHLTDEREWLLRTDTGSAREALYDHLGSEE
jgi:hypothetical protein